MTELVAAPASYFQHLHLQRSRDGRLVHNVCLPWRLNGRLERIAVHDALAALTRRHEILRSGLQATRSETFQVIAPSVEIPLKEVDLTLLPARKRWRRFAQITICESAREFDLTTPPLIRATLTRLDLHEHMLLLTASHAIWDGWSTRIALNEFAACYAASVAGTNAALPPLPLQYADHVSRVSDRVPTDDEHDHRPRGAATLGGSSSVRADRAYEAASLTFTAASSATTSRLRSLARDRHATLAMAVLAGLALLRRTAMHEDEPIIALNDANRDEPSSRQLIGPFLSFLLVAVDLQPALSFDDALAITRDSSLRAYKQGQFAGAGWPRSQPSSPEEPVIHDTWLNFLPMAGGFATRTEPVTAAGLRIHTLPVRGASESRWNDGTLGLTVVETPTRELVATFVYDRSWLTAALVANLAILFQVMLRTLATHPEQRLDAATATPRGERFAAGPVVLESASAGDTSKHVGAARQYESWPG